MKKHIFVKLLLVFVLAFAMLSLTACDAISGITDKLPDSIKNFIPGLKEDSDNAEEPDIENKDTEENKTPEETKNPEENKTPDTTKPEITLTADKTACAIGTTIKITLSATDDKSAADKLTKNYTVTKGDAKVTVTDDTFVAASAGQYVIKATVTDEEGNKTETEIGVVAVNGLTHAGTEADPFTVSEALAIAGTLKEGETTVSKYYFTGKVSKVTGTTYVDVYIDDDDKTIQCYGFNKTEDIPFGTAEGSTTEGMPKKNDVVLIHSNVKHYKGAYAGAASVLELVNNVLIKLTAADNSNVPMVDLENATFINDVAELTSGKYLIVGYADDKKYVMSNLIGQYPPAGDPTATELYLEDYTWEINVENGKISLSDGEKFLAYSGSSTKFASSDTEVFWDIKNETKDGKDLIKAYVVVEKSDGSTQERFISCRTDKAEFRAYNQAANQFISFIKIG